MFTINDKPVTLEQYRRYLEILDRKSAEEKARQEAEAKAAKLADDDAFMASLGE